MDKEKQIDILLQTIDRYWNQAIQLENQRANFTNYFVVIIGAIQGFIIQREFDQFSIILSIIIIDFGAFGALITAKYYERFREQATKVGRLMERLKEIEPAIDLDELEAKANEKHKEDFPILIDIRLNQLWLYFYYVFILLGFIDLIVIVFDLYSKIPASK